MVHWSPLIIIAEEEGPGQRRSLCALEMWRCVFVMSLEKCMIPGNKWVVARGRGGGGGVSGGVAEGGGGGGG